MSAANRSRFSRGSGEDIEERERCAFIDNEEPGIAYARFAGTRDWKRTAFERS